MKTYPRRLSERDGVWFAAVVVLTAGDAVALLRCLGPQVAWFAPSDPGPAGEDPLSLLPWALLGITSIVAGLLAAWALRIPPWARIAALAVGGACAVPFLVALG